MTFSLFFLFSLFIFTQKGYLRESNLVKKVWVYVIDVVHNV